MENIQKAIDHFPWAMRFINVDVNEKVDLSNKTISSIIGNYIGHETITCGDRDLPLKNKYIKEQIHEKNQYYKPYH